MPYKYKEKFLPDNGYRFYRDDRSILVQMLAYGRPLTDTQLVSVAKNFNKYLDTILKRDPQTPAYGPALQRSDFKDLKSEPLYKYVSDSTWNHICKGSFQLGTAEYYRNTPNMNIRDQREGASMFYLVSGNNQLSVAITSGFNCALFCGTSFVQGPDHELMLSRFGRKRIKIDPLDEFVAALAKHIGAFSAHVYDIIYADLKNYLAKREGIERYSEIMGKGKGDTDKTKMRKINESFFSVFYEYGFMPSLFSKPVAYKVERERRVVFERRDDIKSPTLIVEDKSLLKYISLVDDG